MVRPRPLVDASNLYNMYLEPSCYVSMTKKTRQAIHQGQPISASTKSALAKRMRNAHCPGAHPGAHHRNQSVSPSLRNRTRSPSPPPRNRSASPSRNRSGPAHSPARNRSGPARSPSRAGTGTPPGLVNELRRHLASKKSASNTRKSIVQTFKKYGVTFNKKTPSQTNLMHKLVWLGFTTRNYDKKFPAIK